MWVGFFRNLSCLCGFCCFANIGLFFIFVDGGDVDVERLKKLFLVCKRHK